MTFCMGTIFDLALGASETQKLFLIQDYECVFLETMVNYELPHFAIFSTTLSQVYFRMKNTIKAWAMKDHLLRIIGL